MTSKNPKVDAFLSNAEKWQVEMTALRAILLGCPVTEELKWGKPCYTFEGSNVAIIQGFKEYCAILFPKGVLLKDPKKLLIQQTENVQAARQLRFTTLKEITQLKAAIKALVEEAIGAEKSGVEVTYKKTAEFEMPAELESRLKEDAVFKKAFHALTPGRQRGYILHFAGAKQSATRAARIEKCLPRILDGKGLQDD